MKLHHLHSKMTRFHLDEWSAVIQINDLDEWETNGDWGLTSDASEGLYALTDSPDGDYQDGQETFAKYVGGVDLQFVSNPFIKFNAKWDIEPNYDFVRFQAYTEENGWVSLMGNYTVQGNGQIYT